VSDKNINVDALINFVRNMKQFAWLIGRLDIADRAARLVGDPLPSEHEIADLKDREEEPVGKVLSNKQQPGVEGADSQGI